MKCAFVDDYDGLASVPCLTFKDPPLDRLWYNNKRIIKWVTFCCFLEDLKNVKSTYVTLFNTHSGRVTDNIYCGVFYRLLPLNTGKLMNCYFNLLLYCSCLIVISTGSRFIPLFRTTFKCNSIWSPAREIKAQRSLTMKRVILSINYTDDHRENDMHLVAELSASSFDHSEVDKVTILLEEIIISETISKTNWTVGNKQRSSDPPNCFITSQ